MWANQTLMFEDEENVIGKGTFGKVYRVQENGQQFAVKAISIDFIRQYGKHRQLEREVQILKKSSHQNIVRFVSFSKTKTDYHLKMEYCEGRNLRDFLLSDYYRQQILHVNPKYFATKVTLDLLNALVTIRNSLVSNRDIKPDNVIVNVDENGKVSTKLIDFGQSKFHIKLTQSKVGTQGYMAPQVQANQPYTDACDCWSFGMTLYEICEGVRQQYESQKKLFWAFLQNLRKPMFCEYEFYNRLIFLQGIFLTKSRTPKPIRSIIRGLLKADPKQRMTMKKAIEILLEQFQEISACLRPEEIDKQREKLIVSLGLEQNTVFKKKLISQSIDIIDIIFNKVLMPIRNRLPEKEYPRKMYMLKLMKKLISILEENLFKIISNLQIQPEYLFHDILAAVMDSDKRMQMEDLRSCIDNNFKLFRIVFDDNSFQLTKEMENFIQSEFGKQRGAEMIAEVRRFL